MYNYQFWSRFPKYITSIVLACLLQSETRVLLCKLLFAVESVGGAVVVLAEFLPPLTQMSARSPKTWDFWSSIYPIAGYYPKI